MTQTNPQGPDKPDMVIYRLTAKNFLGLEAADMRFDETNRLVTIGGKNGAGKSSALAVLDHILLGPDRKAKKIVHEGADAYLCELEFGTKTIRYIAQRTGTTKKNGGLMITRADDGSQLQTPTLFLEEILGATFVDPMEFVLMQPIEHRNTVADMIELDTSEIDREIEASRDKAKFVETQLTMIEGRVKGMKEHEDAPKERPTVGGLAERLAEAKEHNRKIDGARQMVNEGKAALNEAVQHIADLQAQLKRAVERKEAVQVALAGYEEAVKAPLADEVSIQAEIDGIEEAQRKFDENQAVLAARKEWSDKKKEGVAAKQALEKLTEQKKQMLTEVKFPVEGLGFDETGLTYKGVPYYQCSDAEKLRVAMEISIAKYGRLKPIRIKNGSLLDDDTLKVVAQIAEEAGAQVFVETVSNKKSDGSYDRACTFTIEAGRVVADA